MVPCLQQFIQSVNHAGQAKLFYHIPHRAGFLGAVFLVTGTVQYLEGQPMGLDAVCMGIEQVCHLFTHVCNLPVPLADSGRNAEFFKVQLPIRIVFIDEYSLYRHYIHSR